MTSCRLQSNYSSTVTLHNGPVVLRPVTATPCYIMLLLLTQALTLLSPLFPLTLTATDSINDEPSSFLWSPVNVCFTVICGISRHHLTVIYGRGISRQTSAQERSRRMLWPVLSLESA